jgi:predicted kinase
VSKVLYLMSGIPASGKSTLAVQIVDDFDRKRNEYQDYGRIFSTDEFWGSPYTYAPERAGEAHKWNQRRVAGAMQNGTECIVVDNTNLTNKAIKPYLALAEIFDYTVQVVSVQVSLDEAIARNARRSEDRKIPEAVILDMYERQERLIV